jgi:hypothetical protein
MQDLFMIGIIVVFFTACVGLIAGLEKLKE